MPDEGSALASAGPWPTPADGAACALTRLRLFSKNYTRFDKLPLFLLSVILLSACQSTPPTPLTATAPMPVVLQTDTPPLPPVSLSPTTTLTPAAATDQPFQIDELHMFDEDNGWVWGRTPAADTVLLHTSDGGLSWSNVSPASYDFDNRGAFILDAQSAWIPYWDTPYSQNGLLRTLDGGQSWEELPAVQGRGNGFWHFISQDIGWFESVDVGAGNLFVRFSATRDGGETWAIVPVKPPRPEEGLMVGTIHLCNLCNDLVYYDPQRVILVHGNMNIEDGFGRIGIQVSNDLGDRWSDSELPLPVGYEQAHYAPVSLRFFGENHGVLAVALMATQAGVAVEHLIFFTTDDGGTSWKIGARPDYAFTPHATPKVSWGAASVGFIQCGPAFCVTHDSAQTWQVVTPNLQLQAKDANGVAVNLVSDVEFVSPSVGFAVILDGLTQATSALYKTSDGGRTWISIP
jgi:photosystem II stability/assembly factor-like uncharacterized protein